MTLTYSVHRELNIAQKCTKSPSVPVPFMTLQAEIRLTVVSLLLRGLQQFDKLHIDMNFYAQNQTQL